MFIDIYDFERVVAHLGPGDLVAMLDRVFTQMDLVCQEKGCGLSCFELGGKLAIRKHQATFHRVICSNYCFLEGRMH